MRDKYKNHLRDIQNAAFKYPDHKLIIMGDFNRPNVNRINEPLTVTYSAYQSPNDSNTNTRLCSFYSSMNLKQKYPSHPEGGRRDIR